RVRDDEIACRVDLYPAAETEQAAIGGDAGADRRIAGGGIDQHVASEPARRGGGAIDDGGYRPGEEVDAPVGMHGEGAAVQGIGEVDASAGVGQRQRWRSVTRGHQREGAPFAGSGDGSRRHAQARGAQGQAGAGHEDRAAHGHIARPEVEDAGLLRVARDRYRAVERAAGRAAAEGDVVVGAHVAGRCACGGGVARAQRRGEREGTERRTLHRLPFLRSAGFSPSSHVPRRRIEAPRLGESTDESCPATERSTPPLPVVPGATTALRATRARSPPPWFPVAVTSRTRWFLPATIIPWAPFAAHS